MNIRNDTVGGQAINHIFTLLDAGLTPVIRLRPRKGIDSRLMEVTDADNGNLCGYFIDGREKEVVRLPYSSIINGTITVEEISEVTGKTSHA